MPADPMAQVELEPGERLLRGWPAESVGKGGAKGSMGWLVVTDRRILFYRQAGVFRGSQVVKPPLLSVRVERIRSVSPRQFSMEIGYGDKVAIPGLEIDGQDFRLNRETPSAEVLQRIAEARRGKSGEPLP